MSGAEVRDHRIPPGFLLPVRIPVWAMLAIAAAVLVLAGWAIVSPAPARTVPQPPVEMGRTIPAQRVAAVPVPIPQDPVVFSPPPRPVVERPLMPAGEPAGDSMREEQRRRDYESLFADNVVVSRKPEIAASVSTAPAQPAFVPPPQATAGVVDGVTLREGTVIEAVLTNRLDGSNEGPVNAMVTTDVYAGTVRVIPKGARVLGTASKVTEQYSERLAIAFHRLLLQDGRSVDLDTVPGLDQQGAVGVKDQVNRHYASTFAAAAAVGVLAGLGQLATGGYRRDGGTVVVAGTTDAVTQAAMQTMNHFLMRPPSIQIREGHRIRVYLTKDIQVMP